MAGIGPQSGRPAWGVALERRAKWMGVGRELGEGVGLEVGGEDEGEGAPAKTGRRQ